MEYKDILKTAKTPEEKEKLLKDYYLNDIDILNWMTDNKYQKIKFHDRYEYKFNNQLHRLEGPAVDFDSVEKNQYYIYGETMKKEEWDRKSKKILRLKKLDRI